MFNLLNHLDLVFMYDTSVYHTLCLKFITFDVLHTHFVRMKNYLFTKIQTSLTLVFIK